MTDTTIGIDISDPRDRAAFPAAKLNPARVRLHRGDRHPRKDRPRRRQAHRPDDRDGRSRAAHAEAGLPRRAPKLRLARTALLRERTAALNRARQLTLPLLCRQHAARLRRIRHDLDEVDAAVNALVAADEGLARKAEILCSIPGISTVSAAAILAELPEIGTLDAAAAAAASLAGLAPFTRESGSWKGKARIGGGRHDLRRALYMPAMAAARFNPDLRAVQGRLEARGRPGKLALAAVMRKLVILANALVQQDRHWQPR